MAATLTTAPTNPRPLVLRLAKFGSAICRGDRWRLKHDYQIVVTKTRMFLRCADCGRETQGFEIEG
jgi:hypothetical protein